MFDVPHLLKSVRNTLLNHDIVYENELVSWGHIKHFYKLDSSKPFQLRAAPKLKRFFINPNNFEKMRVYPAAKVLSMSVAAGMETCIKLKELHQCYMSTVRYICLICAILRIHGRRENYTNFLTLENQIRWLF